jgi:predicted DNA-binding transcriptional regulator AlpA
VSRDRLLLAPPGLDGTTPDPVEELRDHPAAGQPATLGAALAPLLLAARQAATLCGVSVATWQRMASAGRCPAPLRLSPGCVRWRREDLVEWVRSGCPSRREWEPLRAQQSGRRS